MIKSVAVRAALGVAMLLSLAAPALAEAQAILVEVDESRIMDLPSVPGAVVIGNPSIADVSIQGQKIFIHGRGYGQTNLTILDLQGNQIGNFSLIGTHNQPASIAVFRGPERYSYSCANFCEAQVQVGDNGGFMGQVAGQMRRKMGLATNSEVDEAKGNANLGSAGGAPPPAPEAPQ